MSRKDKSAASSSGGLDFVPADHCSGEPFVAGRKSRVCRKIENLAIGDLIPNLTERDSVALPESATI
jgi:hypothetical protein